MNNHSIAKLIRWNKNGEVHVGFKHEELLNKPLLDFFEKSEKPKILKAIQQLILEKETIIEANLLLNNGKIRPYEFVGKLISDDGKQYFYGFGNDISTRKKAENTIKESKIRYKLLSDLTFEGILIHQDGIAIDMNEAFARLFNYKAEELLGRNVIELLGDYEDQEKMYSNMKYNYQQAYEVTAFKKTGEQFTAEIVGREIIHEGKKARAISVRDISDRKKKELELTEHQLFIQRITEQSLDIIYIYDIENDKNIYINKDLRDLLGYSKNDLPESSTEIIYEIIHPDDLVQFSGFYDDIQTISEDYVFEYTYRLKAKSGEWRWFAGKEKVFQRQNGLIITMIGTIQEITEQRKFEKALLESEEQLSTIFENAPMVMILITEERKILKMNKSALLQTKREKDEALSKLFGEAFNCINSFNRKGGCGKSKLCDVCRLRELVSDCFTKKQNYYKTEATLYVKEGKKIKERFLLVSTTLMKRMNPRTVLVTLDDITDRKLMEIDLQNAKERAEESNKLKTAFLQNMSHEIRTPMNGIIGFSDMLNRKDISDERKKNYTEIIINSSRQLLDIVNDILDISRIETGQVDIIESETNINHLLNDLYKFYKPQAQNKNIELHVKLLFKDNESNIWVDYIKLRQILNNLLSNALKFTHSGYIKIGYKLEKKDLLFYIEDTGIGIEASFYEKIFEQFRQVEFTSTRQYGGTGLGLSISKAYIQLLGGKLWLLSEKNKGSTFYFTIPYKPVVGNDQILTNHLDISEKPQIKGSPKILIAEDEQANYLLLKELLNDIDIEVIHAKDGEEAIEKAKSEDFSLIFLDIKMPKLNGYEAISVIKQLKPNVPVIAQTAFATSADRLKSINAGFDDYLPKPIMKEALYELIKQYLEIN